MIIFYDPFFLFMHRKEGWQEKICRFRKKFAKTYWL